MEKDTTQFTKSEHTAARRHSLGNILVYLLLTIWALVVLFPFYWMLLTSVKSYSSYNAEHIPTFFTLTTPCRIMQMPLQQCPWENIC